MIIARQTFFPMLVAAFFFVQACGDANQSRLEEIRFLLDKGQVEEALTLATEAVAAQPENIQAKLLFAEANLTAGALSGGAGCQPTDIGFLGLVACLQDAKGDGESDFDTFRRIAPSTVAKLTQVETATNTLTEITTTTVATSDTYLLQFFSKMFEISGAMTRLGSFNPGECTEGPLSSDEEARFQNNLDTVNEDGINAGFPSDFELFTRIDQIKADVAAAMSLSDFFNNEVCS